MAHDLILATDLCMRWEGYRAAPYLCPAGVSTIGYGTTRYIDGTAVTLGDRPLTREQAGILLARELIKLRAPILQLCPILTEHPEALGAVMSWVYNLGLGRLRASTMLKRMTVQDWNQAAQECMRWNKAWGRILPGLVARRAEEANYIRQG